MADELPLTLGQRIKQLRLDSGMSLTQLATRARLSKGYLSTLESESSTANRRPSGESLQRLGDALGVTVADLLGAAPPALPPALEQFADDARLGRADIQMLAAIRFRDRQPGTAEAWRFVYDAIRMSVINPLPPLPEDDST